jgi:hypothetical protein
VLPILIIAAIAVPVLVIAFMASRRSTEAVEHPATEDDAARARNEQEFADAEAYQEQWREQEHEKHPPDTLY